MNTPMLDIIAADGTLSDNSEVAKALDELDALAAAEPINGRGFDAAIACTRDGWLASHGDGDFRRRTELRAPYGRSFTMAEDAIAALKAMLDQWRDRALAEIAAEEEAP